MDVNEIEVGRMAGFSEEKISDASFGLELDKMEIPSVSSTKRVAEGGYRGVQDRSGSGKEWNWASKLKAFLLISGVLLPFALVFFLWDKGVVDLPYLESKKAIRELERYATVGPIMTNVG